jgi:FkbM family methyltransferase
MKVYFRKSCIPVYFSLTQENLNGYYSQLGQDFLIDRYYSTNTSKINFFVDVGAHDGITFSNTYLFEKKYNWRGMCIEPNPNVFVELKSNRNCLIENIAVSSEIGSSNFIAIEGHSNMLSGIESNYSKKHLKRVANEVKSYGQKAETLIVKTNTLKNLFEKHGITRVSFLSIDTEGSELEVLKSIDFNSVEIDFIVIENNEQKRNIKNYLERYNYFCALKIESEEIYSKENGIKLLRSIANQTFRKKSFLRYFVGQLLKYAK